MAENVAIKEIRNLRPPEVQLLEMFYQQWTGQAAPPPTEKELAQARTLLKTHGPNRAKAIIKEALKHMKGAFPNAKTFSAVSYYLSDAIADVDKIERRREREKHEREQANQEAAQVQSHKAGSVELQRHWKEVWYRMTGPEQEEIVRAVKEKFPRYVRIPHLFEKRCIQELADRRRSPTTSGAA